MTTLNTEKMRVALLFKMEELENALNVSRRGEAVYKLQLRNLKELYDELVGCSNADINMSDESANWFKASVTLVDGLWNDIALM